MIMMFWHSVVQWFEKLSLVSKAIKGNGWNNFSFREKWGLLVNYCAWWAMMQKTNWNKKRRVEWKTFHLQLFTHQCVNSWRLPKSTDIFLKRYKLVCQYYGACDGIALILLTQLKIFFCIFCIQPWFSWALCMCWFSFIHFKMVCVGFPSFISKCLPMMFCVW